MKIVGIEPNMSCLKDNCFTIKQYFHPSINLLILIYNINYILFI